MSANPAINDSKSAITQDFKDLTQVIRTLTEAHTPGKKHNPHAHLNWPQELEKAKAVAKAAHIEIGKLQENRVTPRPH